jgi:hypothetical protein
MKMNTCKNTMQRFNQDLTAGCISLALIIAAHRVAAANLTAAYTFGADSSGSAFGGQYWATDASQPPGGYFKMFFATGTPGGISDGLTNAFINGPTYVEAPINIVLMPGTNQFTFFCEPGSAEGFQGLNLFFGGDSIPGISVMAPDRTNATVPSFSADSAPATVGPGGIVAGAGALTYSNGAEKIALSDFFWAEPNVFNVDRVSIGSTTPNSIDDFVGTFTLVVESLAPQVSIRSSQVEVCWNSLSNRMYQVQYRLNLMTNGWADLGSPISGNGSMNCITDAIAVGQTQRFYQVVLLP